jgi:hypothetical protein
MIRKMFIERKDDQKRGFFPQYPIEEAAWIWHPDVCSCESSFLKFRCCFTVSESSGPLRFHASADPYFKLFLDGELVCKGPENSDVQHWSFSSFEWESPSPGLHEITAFVAQSGSLSPLSRMSYRSGFIFAAEGPYAPQLNTGAAEWQVEKLDITLVPYVHVTWTFYAGGHDHIWRGAGFSTAGTLAVPAVVVQDVLKPALHGERREGWLFRPAVLPELTAGRIAPGRFVALKPSELDAERVVFEKQDSATEPVEKWNRLLAGHPVTVPAHSDIALLWDLEDYYCGFSHLETAIGSGAEISWRWMEALYDNEPGAEKERRIRTKSHRDEWVGKLAHGVGDRFCPSGAEEQYFSPWWRAGRFCLIKVKTQDEPLEIRSLQIEENSYPLAEESSLQLDMPCSDEISRICKRGLRVTMQDQYCDSPYYEQTQYIGDSRIESLLVYVMSRDDRVPRRMIDHFDWSRTRFNGITACRYPAAKDAIIETFSLIYILILHDALFWRPNEELIRDKRPAIHEILHYFLRKRNGQGLCTDLIYPYIDAGTYYERGLAPDSQRTPSAPFNLFLLLALKKASEMEEVAGLPAVRDHFSSQANKLGEAIRTVFFCPDRGVFADDPEHLHFSQHAQCLAVLTGLLEGDLARAALECSLNDSSFNKTSLYFRFYFFQALFRCGLEHRFTEHLTDWQTMVEYGLKATTEHPNIRTTRSDCHAWSAHPYYFFMTEVAGIQPAEPGFRSVRVQPQWVGCQSVKASMPHCKGLITVSLKLSKDTCRGTIELPEGLAGTFAYGGQKIPLKTGMNILS